VAATLVKLQARIDALEAENVSLRASPAPAAQTVQGAASDSNRATVGGETDASPAASTRRK
jgi:hypothetical protein